MKKTQTMAFANLIASILFLALGGWALAQMQSLQQVKNTYAQPSMFPAVMAGGLLFFSVILLIQSLLRLARPVGPDTEPAPTINLLKDKGIQAAALVIALCILYVALFKVLGYVLVSAVVAFIIMFLIGKRNWVQMVLISILVPLVMFLIFYKILTVSIPMGPLSFLRDLLDTI